MIPQIQDTLNMLRTPIYNNKFTAYKAMKGAFDRNRMPMAPLDNKSVMYIIPDMRNTFTPHCHEAYTVFASPKERPTPMITQDGEAPTEAVPPITRHPVKSPLEKVWSFFFSKK